MAVFLKIKNLDFFQKIWEVSIEKSSNAKL